jgi:hypothetical protein
MRCSMKLRQALTVTLSQSPFLSLVTDQKIRETLRFMGRTGDEPVTEDVAPEVCQRANAKAFIAGSTAAIGSSDAITLDARNCASGDSLASEQVEASSKETVLRSLGTAASAMRTRLGESLASVQRLDVQLDQATTESLEALKVYALAQSTRTREGDLAALPLYVQATKLDPDFAMAWARVANINSNLNRRAAMREAAERAYALRERGSQVEQWYVLATYQSVFLNDQHAAADTYRLWHQAYPRDYVPPNNLRAAIALARRDAASVLTLTDTIQPRTFFNSFVPMLRGQAQLQLGNGAAAAAEFQTILDHPGVFPNEQAEAHVGLARAYTLAGDAARARKAYEAFFEFWKRADPDVPLLLEAKAESAKLST